MKELSTSERMQSFCKRRLCQLGNNQSEVKLIMSSFDLILSNAFSYCLQIDQLDYIHPSPWSSKCRNWHQKIQKTDLPYIAGNFQFRN